MHISLLQMAPKVMTIICIFEGWEKAHSGGHKWQNLSKLFLDPNAPKSHFGISHDQNLCNWGLKMPKCANTYCFAPNSPKRHLVVSHDEKLHIWIVEKGPFWGSKM